VALPGGGEGASVSLPMSASAIVQQRLTVAAIYRRTVHAPPSTDRNPVTFVLRGMSVFNVETPLHSPITGAAYMDALRLGPRHVGIKVFAVPGGEFTSVSGERVPPCWSDLLRGGDLHRSAPEGTQKTTGNEICSSFCCKMAMNSQNAGVYCFLRIVLDCLSYFQARRLYTVFRHSLVLCSVRCRLSYILAIFCYRVIY